MASSADQIPIFRDGCFNSQFRSAIQRARNPWSFHRPCGFCRNSVSQVFRLASLHLKYRQQFGETSFKPSVAIASTFRSSAAVRWGWIVRDTILGLAVCHCVRCAQTLRGCNFKSSGLGGNSVRPDRLWLLHRPFGFCHSSVRSSLPRLLL